MATDLRTQSRYGCLIVAACGAFSCIPPLLGWISSNLHSTAAVGLANALNISWGAPGQIVGVWIYKSTEATKGYPTGHCEWTAKVFCRHAVANTVMRIDINFGMLLMVAVLCVAMRLYYGWRNRRGGAVDGVYFKY
jgi:hypothetical protein